jgi:NAD(P)-dependent dehydrogenase (short-subunit alcohol dehydrogenase family)
MRFLAGETALVTGAGKGIGRALALALGGAGARVILVSRTAADVDEAAGRIRESGGEALGVSADVGNPQCVTEAVRTAAAAFGPITILATGGPPSPSTFMDRRFSCIP